MKTIADRFNTHIVDDVYEGSKCEEELARWLDPECHIEESKLQGKCGDASFYVPLLWIVFSDASFVLCNPNRAVPVCGMIGDGGNAPVLEV